MQTAGGVGGEGERLDAAADFAARVFHRLAAFLRHRWGDAARLVLDDRGGFGQDGGAALRGHGRHCLGDSDGAPNRGAHVGFACFLHRIDHAVIIWVDDFE